MADFKQAFDYMIPHECYRAPNGDIIAYSNCSSDRGGMTFAGIARNFWPNWAGWKILDQCHIMPHLRENRVLDQMVVDFYHKNFWNPMGLEGIMSQEVANYVFDKGVNGGTETSLKKLQKAITACGQPIKIDGVCGPATVKACNMIDSAVLISKLREIWRDYYKAIVAANPSQEKFLRSWLARC